MAPLVVQRRTLAMRPNSPIIVLRPSRQHYHSVHSRRVQAAFSYHPPPLSPSSMPTACRSPLFRFANRKSEFHVQLHGLMLAPIVFVGLFVALWTWKCCMLVLFQNKIIFMPGMPPNSRRETIKDYAARCAGINWREERVRAADNTDLALCVADVSLGHAAPIACPPAIRLYILYFQGQSRKYKENINKVTRQ